jgi:hypothetical protein
LAKKKLMTYRQWQQLNTQRKAERQQRHRERKAQRLAAWWAIPATSNYVDLSATLLRPEEFPPGGTFGRSGEPIPEDHVCIEGSILPDKRRRPRASRLSIRVMVDGSVDRTVVATQLIALAERLLTSEEIWRVASGSPLSAPVNVIGTPPRIVERSWWRQAPMAAQPDGGADPEGIGALFYDRQSRQLVVDLGDEQTLDEARETIRRFREGRTTE